MHELSLAQSLVEQIMSAVREGSATKVFRVVVSIGPYSGVEKTAFEFAFPFAAEGTPAEGAELFIKDSPARIECNLCHETSDANPTHLVCPCCGSDDLNISGGHEFLLQELELEIASF